MSQPEKNASDQPLPGSVSNQNAEQAEPGHEDGGSGGDPSPSRGSSPREKRAGSGGESGEGTQSTGNPNSAG